MEYNARTIAQMIDQTLLKPEVTPEQVRLFCENARAYGFAAVCVEPIFVPLAVETLAGSGIKTAAVAGFPLGTSMTRIKAAEASLAVSQGAMEVDMVLPVGKLIAGDAEAVRYDIQSVVEAAKRSNENCVTKVIFENCLLSDEQKRLACQIALSTDVDFVKTSTGFSSGGATAQDVRLMAECVAGKKRVKAAGGVRTLDDLLEMVACGAQRIGTSAGAKIVEEARARFGD